MGIIVVVLVKPEVDRHISKKISKTKKLIVCIELRHFKSHSNPSKNVFKMP